jgi:hypothetical protein
MVPVLLIPPSGVAIFVNRLNYESKNFMVGGFGCCVRVSGTSLFRGSAHWLLSVWLYSQKRKMHWEENAGAGQMAMTAHECKTVLGRTH